MVMIVHMQVVILKQEAININEEQRKFWFLSKCNRNDCCTKLFYVAALAFFDSEKKQKGRTIAAFIA